ncbi:MAG: hypothetical protein EBS36_05265 [Actinobacteria bacterium]|nr:hypothetical protein [Actinomycetota bacterium]NBY15250.1 hypothetical protein [Actinomycetota bacterium]
MVNDSVLAQTIRELDEFVAAAGWDRPARLFGIVENSTLALDHPELLAENATIPYSFVEQEIQLDNENLIDSLAKISWPAEIGGAAISVERLISMQPDEELAPESGENTKEIRILALVMRNGENLNAIRQRAFDDADNVSVASDLVPALNLALLQTLQD